MNAEPLAMEAHAAGERPASHRHVWLVLAFIAVGCFVRIWNFYGPELWTDEYASYWTVADGSWKSVMLRNNGYSTTQPLYFLLLNVSVRSLGRTEFALRLPSVIFGCLALPALYLLFAELIGRKRALLALFLAALNPLLIYYGREARPYALCLLLSALSFWAFACLLRRPESKRHWMLWLVSTVALVYTHGIYGLALAVQNLVAIVFVVRAWPLQRKFARRWIGFQFLAFLLIIPVLLQLASVFGRRQDINFSAAGPDMWQAMSFFTAPAVFAGLVAGLLLWSLSGRQEVLRFRDERNGWGFSILVCMFVVPTLALGVLGMKQHMLFELRYRLIAAIGALGMVSVFVLGWRNRIIRFTLLTTVVCALVGQTVVSVCKHGTFATDFDEMRGAKHALNAMRALVEDGEPVVIRPVLSEGNTRFDSDDPLWQSYISCEVSSFYAKNSIKRLCLPMTWRESQVNERFKPKFSKVVLGVTRFWYFGFGDGHEQSFTRWLGDTDGSWCSGRRITSGNYVLTEFVKKTAADGGNLPPKREARESENP